MKRMTTVLVLALLLMAPALAGAASFKALYVFGDSLSDPGNAAAMSGGQFPPSSQGYAERFSNGPVAAEYLAAFMAVPGGPAELGGTNFAVGGATTGTENYNFEVGELDAFPEFETTGVAAQIANALAGPAFDPSRTLFLVWGGPNDVFLALRTDPSTIPEVIAQAVENLTSDVASLADAGARYILVPNMADLGATPSASAEGLEARLSAVSEAFNAALAPAMSALQRRLRGRVRIAVVDTFAAQRLIVQRPRLFGFTDTKSFCLAHPEARPACKGFVFFDPVHATTAAHRIIGTVFAASCFHFGKSCFRSVGHALEVP